MVSYHQQLISTVPMLRSQAADRKPTQIQAKHGDEKKKSTSSITTKNNLVIYFVSRMLHFHEKNKEKYNPLYSCAAWL